MYETPEWAGGWPLYTSDLDPSQRLCTYDGVKIFFVMILWKNFKIWYRLGHEGMAVLLPGFVIIW